MKGRESGRFPCFVRRRGHGGGWGGRRRSKDTSQRKRLGQGRRAYPPHGTNKDASINGFYPKTAWKFLTQLPGPKLPLLPSHGDVSRKSPESNRIALSMTSAPGTLCSITLQSRPEHVKLAVTQCPSSTISSPGCCSKALKASLDDDLRISDLPAGPFLCTRDRDARGNRDMRLWLEFCQGGRPL